MENAKDNALYFNKYFKIDDINKKLFRRATQNEYYCILTLGDGYSSQNQEAGINIETAEGGKLMTNEGQEVFIDG